MTGKSKTRKIDMIDIIVYIMTAIPFIVILLPILLFVFVPVYNNIKLEFFANQIFDYPLPPSSKVISTNKKVGNFTGSSKHCDFLATMIISTSLSKDEIKDYYKKLKIYPAKNEYIKKEKEIKDCYKKLQLDLPQAWPYVEAEVFLLEKAECDSYGVYRLKNNYNASETRKENKRQYVIQIQDGGYSATFELRGR